MKLCIDLCSGLGGFSSAFKDDPNWEVITLDIDPKFKPSIVADVCFLPFKKNLTPDILLASPPCERFSVACHSFPKMGIKKAMEVVGAVFEAVAYLKPKHWLIENPMGRLRWFLGKPPQTIRLCDYGSPYRKLTDLWGDLALPMLNAQHNNTAYVETEGHMNAKHPLPRITNARHEKAKLPLGLSQAVRKGMEGEP